jgi:biopolymer transport protein ExbB
MSIAGLQAIALRAVRARASGRLRSAALWAALSLAALATAPLAVAQGAAQDAPPAATRPAATIPAATSPAAEPSFGDGKAPAASSGAAAAPAGPAAGGTPAPPAQAGDETAAHGLPARPATASPGEPGTARAEAVGPVARADLPHDLSPWGMFLAADWVVKAVMIGLAFASVVTWTVALVKSLELAVAGRRLGRDRAALGAAEGLAPAAALPLGPEAAALVGAAVEEVRLSPGLPTEGVKERVASRLERVEAGVTRALRRGTGALATIGATAPFVGLFGTVWGIMNSFIGISEAQTTNLAVVAPGIAEALLATAIGLVAAIPAVVLYNHFARRIADRRQALADAAAAVLRLVSRDLDRRAARGLAAAAE